MPSSVVVYDSIASSNMPGRTKSAVLNFLNRYQSAGSSFLARYPEGRTAALLKGGQSTLRQQGEAALFGAALAITKNTIGLELGARKIPVDGLIAAAALGAGYLLGNRGSGLATECRNLAASSLTLLSYRKADALMTGGTSKLKTKVSGEDDYIDPVIASAETL